MQQSRVHVDDLTQSRTCKDKVDIDNNDSMFELFPEELDSE